MFKLLKSLSLVLCLIGGSAFAQNPPAPVVAASGPFPAGAIPITGSATGTTTATATLANVVGRTTYMCGFQATYTGATAAGAGTITAFNVMGGNLNYVAPQVIITNNNQTPMIVTFFPCVPANSLNTSITIGATLGAGTTNVAITATGFQQ